MIDVIPGILEKEWNAIVERIALVAPYTEWVQIDIADNTIVPNETLTDVSKFKELLSLFPHLKLEAHLMVAEPEKYIKPLADAGFRRAIAHVEATDPRTFLAEIQYEEMEVGVAIDGLTEFDQIEPFLDAVDCVLVMTIEAGFSGQSFMPETMEKVKLIRQNFPDLPIEVDGGINDQTAKVAIEAGATRLAATSYIFKHPDGIPAAIEKLKNA